MNKIAMYTVYALYSSNLDRIYVGQTGDLDERLRAHADKRFGRCYTARGENEWKLIYTEEVPTRSLALQREKQLKIIPRKRIHPHTYSGVAQW